VADVLFYGIAAVIILMSNVSPHPQCRTNLTCKPAETRNFSDLLEDQTLALAQHQGLTADSNLTIKRDIRAHSVCVNSEFENNSPLMRAADKNAD
jgi:hypothetical protein